MNISEMHVYFRTYGERMGMQNVRAILPEQIDVFINTAISDIVNQLVRDKVGVKNGRVVADKEKLNQLSAINTLYRRVELDMSSSTPFMELKASDAIIGKMSNKYDNGGTISNVSTTVMPSYLYLVDFALSYKNTETGYSGEHAGAAPIDDPLNSIITKEFPVRFIDEAFLADTLNDAILKNSISSPILVLYNNDTFDLYIDKFRKNIYNDIEYYVLENKFVPYKFKVSYIATPNKVKYASDINKPNVDCNLPESMHIDIVKYAVDLYNISINKGSYNKRNQQQELNSAE